MTDVLDPTHFHGQRGGHRIEKVSMTAETINCCVFIPLKNRFYCVRVIWACATTYRCTWRS
jgi:hypothetical protein